MPFLSTAQAPRAMRHQGSCRSGERGRQEATGQNEKGWEQEASKQMQSKGPKGHRPCQGNGGHEWVYEGGKRRQKDTHTHRDKEPEGARNKSGKVVPQRAGKREIKVQRRSKR